MMVRYKTAGIFTTPMRITKTLLANVTTRTQSYLQRLNIAFKQLQSLDRTCPNLWLSTRWL